MFLSFMFLTTQALAVVVPERRLAAAEAVCYPGEAKTLFCYKRPQGTPQDVKIGEILFAAASLRE
jgi:hypothetical protein